MATIVRCLRLTSKCSYPTSVMNSVNSSLSTMSSIRFRGQLVVAARRSARRPTVCRSLSICSSNSPRTKLGRRPSGRRPRRRWAGGSTARAARGRSRRWPRLPSGCRSARSRCRPARRPCTGCPRRCCARSPASVISPRGTVSRSSAVTCTSSRRRSIWLGRACGRRTPPWPTATRPGWATQVPSWPSPASRTLSARTFSSASSLASGRS